MCRCSAVIISIAMIWLSMTGDRDHLYHHIRTTPTKCKWLQATHTRRHHSCRPCAVIMRMDLNIWTLLFQGEKAQFIQFCFDCNTMYANFGSGQATSLFRMTVVISYPIRSSNIRSRFLWIVEKIHLKKKKNGIRSNSMFLYWFDFRAFQIVASS